MGDQIPVIPEKPLATCGCRKFQIHPLDDHLTGLTPSRGGGLTGLTREGRRRSSVLDGKTGGGGGWGRKKEIGKREN